MIKGQAQKVVLRREFLDLIKGPQSKDVVNTKDRLLRSVCILLDEIVTGENVWVTLGRTRDGSALVVKVMSDRETLLSVYAGSAPELADKLSMAVEASVVP